MVYLDNAATSFPKPPCVAEALAMLTKRLSASPGRGSYTAARAAEAVVDKTREAIARLFHADDARRIIFTLNATDALNMAIRGIVRQGDHVVTTTLEHNSVARPLTALERAGVITVARVPASPDGFVDPQDIRRALKRPTRLVAVTHASNVLGTLQPITVIGYHAREFGALMLVDASQTAGSFPIHVESACADLLAFPGHKGLLGPPGTGGLYVGARAERRIRPWREGGTGVLSELPMQPEELPLRLEAGSPNTWGIAVLGEAVRAILSEGVEQIRHREMERLAQLLSAVQEDERFILYGTRDLSQRVAVQSLNRRGMPPAALANVMDREYDIAVRAGLHCAPGVHHAIGTLPDGTVRISPGYGTTTGDIAACVAALRAVASRAPVEEASIA